MIIGLHDLHDLHRGFVPNKENPTCIVENGRRTAKLSAIKVGLPTVNVARLKTIQTLCRLERLVTSVFILELIFLINMLPK